MMLSSAPLLALVGIVKNSRHAKQLPARLPPPITLKQITGIMNLSVGLPVSVEMYVQENTSFSAAPVRQTVVEMARVALALEFALDQHRSFLVPSRASTIVLSISACSQTSIPSNTCAMTSMMLSTASGYPCPEVCSSSIAHLRLPARQRSRRQPTSIAPLPCVDDVVIRVVDLWQVTSCFSLEPLKTRHPLSRSRSVTHVPVYRITQTV